MGLVDPWRSVRGVAVLTSSGIPDLMERMLSQRSALGFRRRKCQMPIADVGVPRDITDISRC